MSDIEYKARIRANKYMNPRWDFAHYSSAPAMQKQYNKDKREFIISASQFTKSETKEIKDSPTKNGKSDKLRYDKEVEEGEEIKNVSPIRRNKRISSFAPICVEEENEENFGSKIMIENKIEPQEEDIRSIIPPLNTYKLIESVQEKKKIINKTRKEFNHYSTFIEAPMKSLFSPSRKLIQNDFLEKSEGDRSEFLEEDIKSNKEEAPPINNKDKKENNYERKTSNLMNGNFTSINYLVIEESKQKSDFNSDSPKDKEESELKKEKELKEGKPLHEEGSLKEERKLNEEYKSRDVKVEIDGKESELSRIYLNLQINRANTRILNS